MGLNLKTGSGLSLGSGLGLGLGNGHAYAATGTLLGSKVKVGNKKISQNLKGVIEC